MGIDKGMLPWINRNAVERAHAKAIEARETNNNGFAKKGMRAARARDSKLLIALEQATEILQEMQEEQIGRSKRSNENFYQGDLTEYSLWKNAYEICDKGEPTLHYCWIYGAAAELAGVLMTYSYPNSFYTLKSGAGGGGSGVEEIITYDFTDTQTQDISANGTYNILKGDGSALTSIVTSTDGSSGNITGTNNVSVTASQGIVVDVSSGGGAENVVLGVALPTTLKSNFDQDYLMFEWLCSGIAMTGNNSLIKFKVSTVDNMRGTPSNGLVVIKSAAASGFDSKGERQYNTSVSRSSADQSAFTGGNLHIQLLMRRHSGIVYIGTGTSFAEPYTLATSFGLGGRTWSLTRPVGQTSIPQWNAPYMGLQFYCNTTANAAEAVIKKFRICKFRPSVT